MTEAGPYRPARGRARLGPTPGDLSQEGTMHHADGGGSGSAGGTERFPAVPATTALLGREGEADEAKRLTFTRRDAA